METVTAHTVPSRAPGPGRPARRWTRLLPLATAAALAAALAGCGRRTIVGDSMAPALAAGDRVLSWRVPAPLRALLVRPGAVVVARDPRAPERELVKRVASVSAGRVVLHGDHAGASTDSRAFGPVPLSEVTCLVWYRYAPAGRVGRIRVGPGDGRIGSRI